LKPTKTLQHTITVTIMILFAFLSITTYNVTATNGISVPPPTTIITLEAANGTLSYFLTTLNDIPSGYDVTNSTYAGWCVDTTADMSRSPATHLIILYSSLNPPNGTIADQRWDAVNYILNHKQGTTEDVQAAIWYFINFDNVTTTPPSSQTTAWAIINDTLANGTGYTPALGQTAAVICDPVMLLPRPAPVQINIIEVTITETVPEYPTIAITLIAITAVSIALIYTKKATRHYDKPKTPT
jgi:hypothetical protein